MISSMPSDSVAQSVPAPDMIEVRQSALDLLRQVLDRKQPLDQALDNQKDQHLFSGRDRRFIRMVVATTLRRLGQIDDVIARLQDKPGNLPHPCLQHILRLGITQILFMDVADHAAVDTSVELAVKEKFERYKGLVNAILRNALRQGEEIVAKQDPARLNTPDWLLKTWISDYGLGEAAKIASANLIEAPLDITLKDESTRNFWSSEFQAINFPTGSLRLPNGMGAVPDLPGYEDGMWFVQDASASLPVKLLVSGAGIEKTGFADRHVLDIAAAPGGKTAQLAAMGAQVTAIDRSAKRLQRLRDNMQRLRLEEHVEIVITDAMQWRPKEPYDLILLDAPCSATGTMRRHPDLAHLKTPQDMKSLVDIQARMLSHAFEILAPGGVLVYCVCSLQKDEGERQIAQLLTQHQNACKMPIQNDEVDGIEDIINDDGDIRILPYHAQESGGMDGFFISRITKA